MKVPLHQIIGLVSVWMLLPASAATVYSGLLNTVISTDFAGVTVAIDGGTINPFFGGLGVANNDLLQPFRDGTANTDTLRNFSTGDILNASSLYLSTGFGGSEDHVGSAFTAGQEGYVGFKLNGVNYGWMRVVFTDNTGGAVIKDWAYDDSGASIVVGGIRQVSQDILAISGSTVATQLVDSGGATNLIKSGAGTTTTLTGSNTYTGTTTVNSGTLALATGASLANTSSINIEATGTLAGRGTLAGPTVIKNLGVHSPGTSIGVQTFSSGLTYQTGATLNWELSQNAAASGDRDSYYDGVNVNGTLSIATGVTANLVFNSAGSVVDWSDPFWGSAHSWLVYDNTNSPTLSSGTIFDTIQVSNDSQSHSLSGGVFSWNQTGNDVYLTYTLIPEPSTALLLALCGFALLRRRRND